MSNVFAVGDIVVYRKKGFWRITQVEKPSNQMYTPTYHIELIMHQDGRIPKKRGKGSKAYQYHLSKIDLEGAKKQKDADQQKWENLINIIAAKKDPFLSEKEQELDIPEPEIFTVLGPPQKLGSGD